MLPFPSFTTVDLGDNLAFFTGQVPEDIHWDAATFEVAWNLHPEVRPSIQIVGRQIQVPRWHQAYGEDYRFSGQVTASQPTPSLLLPLLAWTRRAIHPALNGLLVNWYEGPSHYIGPHHDSTKNMIVDAPIVTISFGEERVFRLTRGKGRERQVKNFPAKDGTVFILPQETNAAWKHSVPKSGRYTGRRVSVTIRGFESWRMDE
jgi:alkylated DNA repair dioxygenase AlkB